ncbi:MAG: AAA family ATPase [Rhodobacteraceae bacterium]|nr:AAA family ATPase [Paracoccaceae bacterium]
MFLTNSISQQIDTFRPVYDWFKDTLVLKAPDSRFASFEHSLDEDPSPTTLNEIMTNLDTGISRLGGDEFSFENIPIPEILKRKIKEEIKEGTTIRLVSSLNERFIITQKFGELVTKKLVTFHPRSDGTEAKFDIQKESDGTQRMIDLLPAFLDVLSLHLKKVYVIDEFGRSLHTLLTRELIEAYLENCSALSRTQLLITTHDVLLMDQGLFRRDELWVAERNHNGSSQLIPFSNYKDVRYDKDIRKSYLEGRLGGVPRILMGSELAHQREND